MFFLAGIQTKYKKMEENVHDTKFLRVKLDIDKRLVSIHWKSTTENMSDKEFVEEVKLYLSKLKEYKPVLVLNNLTDFEYTISPEMQKWYADMLGDYNVYPQKVAILLPKEFMSELSFEQTRDEVRAKHKQTSSVQYYGDEIEAKKWLLS